MEVDFLDPQAKGRPGTSPGSIDYRLTRSRVLRQFRAGELTETDICDAQRELMRVAHGCSVAARTPCPVCGQRGLKIVRFVFGPRMPAGGRAVASEPELARLSSKSGEHRCYVVEVCVDCRWNHLQSTYVLGAERSA